jgi:preprotein translocase subunit SecF
MTVVITLTALLLFGGSAIYYFVLALLIGIVSGTYSSIFNASPLVVVWQEWEDRRRGRLAAAGRPSRRASS